MNDCKFSGRPTKDPEIRYTEGAQPTAIARYTLAVDRRYKKEGGQQYNTTDTTGRRKRFYADPGGRRITV